MKTLIIYATKYGCTKKAAELLKSKLGGEVKIINIMNEEIKAFDYYDTVILGGSIYVGKIQKQLINFITQNLPLLLNKKIGLFICAGETNKEIMEKEFKTAFPIDLSNKAVVKGVFGYEIYYEKLNFIEKFMMKKIKGVEGSEYKLSEEKIKNFAEVMSSGK